VLVGDCGGRSEIIHFIAMGGELVAPGAFTGMSAALAATLTPIAMSATLTKNTILMT
jgi:hypothetical protein